LPLAAQGKAKGKRRGGSSTDGSETVPVPRTGRRVSVAWLLLLLVVGVAGLGGFYVFEQWQTAEEELRDARVETVSAHSRAADADQRALASKADLTRERGERTKMEKDLAAAGEQAEKKADELAGRLAKLVGADGTVTRDKDRLTLEMVDQVLFRSGEASLTPKGEAVLAKVGEELKKFPERQIWVQGHTDDVPITGNVFSSNWELSTARALTVVHYLEDVAEVDPRRLAAVGFAEHRPVSRSKRFRNRRIEIVLFPRDVRLIND